MGDVQNILNSLLESKTKYIEVLDEDDESIFKIKLIMEESRIVTILDKFFDNGYKVRKISKEDFDNFEGTETFNINI